MGSGKFIRFDGAHQKAIADKLRKIAHRHNLWRVFQDFVAMAALAFSVKADPSTAKDREAEYMRTIQGYTLEELKGFAECMGELVMAMESGPQDYLGSLYMQLELGNAWKGQFFTPYHLCKVMAAMQFTSAPELVARNGFVRVSDPCVGGGAMLIAAAEALQDAGINYQRHMFAIAQDLDITAVHMAYVQLSLMHVPALVYHGNTLAMEVRSTWKTLAYTMGGWANKLQRLRNAEALATAAERIVGDVEPAGENPAPAALPIEAGQDQRTAPGGPRDAESVPVPVAAPVARFEPSEKAKQLGRDREALRAQMQISLF